MNDRPDPVVVRLDEQFAAWTGTATPEIVGLIATLFGAEGDTRTRSLFDWQYLEHLGGAHVCIAYTDRGLFAEPAALYAAFPTRFQLNGHSSIAYQSFDTLTVAAFRGRGLFVRLADLPTGRLRIAVQVSYMEFPMETLSVASSVVLAGQNLTHYQCLSAPSVCGICARAWAFDDQNLWQRQAIVTC